MKMADGGFRPGFNVQLATAGDPVSGPRTIVGVRVTNVGSDCRRFNRLSNRSANEPASYLKPCWRTQTTRTMRTSRLWSFRG